MADSPRIIIPFNNYGSQFILLLMTFGTNNINTDFGPYKTARPNSHLLQNSTYTPPQTSKFSRKFIQNPTKKNTTVLICDKMVDSPQTGPIIIILLIIFGRQLIFLLMPFGTYNIKNDFGLHKIAINFPLYLENTTIKNPIEINFLLILENTIFTNSIGPPQFVRPLPRTFIIFNITTGPDPIFNDELPGTTIEFTIATIIDNNNNTSEGNTPIALPFSTNQLSSPTIYSFPENCQNNYSTPNNFPSKTAFSSLHSTTNNLRTPPTPPSLHIPSPPSHQAPNNYSPTNNYWRMNYFTTNNFFTANFPTTHKSWMTFQSCPAPSTGASSQRAGVYSDHG